MSFTPRQVINALKEQKYAPVYFLQGEEPYYIDFITNYLEEKILSTAEKSFNLTVVYGKDHTMVQVLTHARRYPVAAARQVVIVKEAQELQDLRKEEGQKLLASYVQAPQPATLLAFACKHKPLDARTTLSKILAQYGVVMHARRVHDNQLPAWIMSYVQAQGLAITQKASLMLQELVGNDLTRLASELDKVRLNLQRGHEIDDAAVQAYVGISKQFNVFELQKALAHQDMYKANQIVLYFAANPKNTPAISLVNLLFIFFSKVLLVHHAKDKSPQSLASTLQVNPYFVQEYLLAAQHFPLPKAMENIHHLHQADLQLKGIDYPTLAEGAILKELIFKLMH
ncbi:MAG: DNA polymerase III subunit delta [Bacteroidota bacterium]